MRFDIPDSELQWRFGPSGGPGGQHANKTATRVELTFDVAASSVFDTAMRARLVDKLGPTLRVIEDGSRSQATNRKRALRRLGARIDEAARPDPPSRKPTRPSLSARRRRLADKRRRGQRKEHRKPPRVDE